MNKWVVAGIVMLLPAAAQAADPVAFAALQKGEYSAAEARLTTQLARGSEEPGVLLNLAHVYGREGRLATAANLYRHVLAERNVQMELADGSPAWSHDLAGRGLARVTETASR